MIFFILFSLFAAPIRILNELLPEPDNSTIDWIITLGQIVLFLPFVFYFASRRSGEFIEPKKKKQNQQVDPIVTTPVDEVEAQSTQGHP